MALLEQDSNRIRDRIAFIQRYLAQEGGPLVPFLETLSGGENFDPGREFDRGREIEF
ncbi:hypothetical protein [Nitrospirillum sp. BR 11828]|uniref:hypothetical protein n=1 Tax=Nitrospirillum sp. BR 11828 TaxID=3104325 RepID=UPI002ACA4418|nr:hypothetical protein [Nitrospirillum sp. BR 11828]MDZ5649018.1 hypothetical protein [Nitrospirillum sp. BR 11828]